MLGLGLKIGRIFKIGRIIVNKILLLMNEEVYVFQDNNMIGYWGKLWERK